MDTTTNGNQVAPAVPTEQATCPACQMPGHPRLVRGDGCFRCKPLPKGQQKQTQGGSDTLAAAVVAALLLAAGFLAGWLLR